MKDNLRVSTVAKKNSFVKIKNLKEVNSRVEEFQLLDANLEFLRSYIHLISIHLNN